MDKKTKPLGPLHADSLKRADYNKPPEAAKGFPNTTPGYSGPPTITRVDKEKAKDA